MKKLNLWIIITIISILVVPAYSFALDTTVEKTALKGDWNEIDRLLWKDDTKANDPVARLLMAHATLTTNRNNASLLLFLSAKEESDITAWSEWTESLLNKHPDNPIALYLSADAEARTGRLEEAKERFTQALEKNKDFALAYNTRGIVRMLTNDWDMALQDFLQATNLSPDFADAHANLGNYYILIEAADGALEEFNKALTINPDFAMAYNGRGCAYFGQGKFDEAAQDFVTASQLSSVLVVSEINQGFASAYATRLIALGSMEKRPGTTLEFRQYYQDNLKKQQQELLNILPSKSDKEFWKNINNLPSLPDDQLQSFVKEYTLQKVQMGAFFKMQELKGEIAENYQKKLPLSEKLDFTNRVLPDTFSSLDLVKGSWKSFFSPHNVSNKENLISNILKPYSSTASNKDVTLYITDFGINQWKADFKMGDDFTNAKAKVFHDIPRNGQILIPMPDDKSFQKMIDSELTQKIFQSVKARVEGGITVGTKVFELQLVEHIQTPGYFDADRQKAVNRFGKSAYEAIGMVNDYLKNKNLDTHNYAICGSNGCKVFTENIPVWKSYLNKADLFDGRAFKTPAIEMIKTLHPENVRFFNTGGDWFAENLPIAHSIANHDVVKDIKKEIPGITSIWLKPLDNSVAKGHLAGMNQDAKFLAKILNHDAVSYTVPKEMTGRDLLPKPEVKYTGITSNLITSAKLQLIDTKVNRMNETHISVQRLTASIETFNKGVGFLENLTGQQIPNAEYTKIPLTFIPSIIKDINEKNHNPLTSHTLEQVGKFGLKTLPSVVDHLKDTGKILQSFKIPPTLFGIDEFVAGGASQLGSGRLGIDEITHYLDGVSKMTAAVAGGLVAGPPGTKIFESGAGLAQDVFRGLTMPIFQEVANQPVRQNMIKDWQTLQTRRMYDGLPVQHFSEMFTTPLLKEVKFDSKVVNDLDRFADWANTTKGGTQLQTPIPISYNGIRQSTSRIPGYYSSTDRPLTEIGSLASMVDKGITKPTDGSVRRALIVAQDPFRGNLQQQELHKYGFETKVIPQGIDVQTEAKQWGADVILGIRGTAKMESPQTVVPIEKPTRNYFDNDVYKKDIRPLFPPDKGGGAAGISQKSQSLPQNWDWGKQYTPTYPKGGPGGISTEELGKSFVDKGNWPVITAFGLGYNVKDSVETQSKKEEE